MPLAIFVSGPFKGKRIISSLTPKVVVQRADLTGYIGVSEASDIPIRSAYGEYEHMGEGVYRWCGWDDD